jgi:hypothetical protein
MAGVRRLLMPAAVAVAMFVGPSVADAQTFVQPFVALVDGGRAGCAAAVRNFCHPARLGAGVSAGLLKSTFGLEGDISYKPDFFGAPDRRRLESHVVTAMADVLVLSAPARIRVYATGGGGVARTSISGADVVAKTETTWLLGAGVGGLVSLASAVGLRGELRWMRTFDNLAADFGLPTAIAPDVSYFYRLSLGILVSIK